MRIWYLLGWVLLLQCVTSCNHDELCYHHPHNAKVRVDVDWSKFVQEVPTGMTVMVYPQEGSLTEVVTQHTNTTGHALFSLPVGRYHSIVYNQSPSEFGSLSFRGMEKFETAEVFANPTDSRWYVSRGDEEGRVVTDPEWLGTDQVKDMMVTPEMVEKTGQDNMSQLGKGTPTPRTNNSFLIGEHTPLNIVYTVTVTVHIEGIYNLRSARASLSGLAEGYWLGQGKPTANKVTHLLEDWKMTLDPDDPTKGTIVAQITCFGLPEGHQGKPEENELGLSVLLVDNKTILDFPFYVGSDFEEQIEEDVRLELRLFLEVTLPTPLPDVKPEGGSSGGFDATVDDWGEEEEIDVNM